MTWSEHFVHHYGRVHRAHEETYRDPNVSLVAALLKNLVPPRKSSNGSHPLSALFV